MFRKKTTEVVDEPEQDVDDQTPAAEPAAGDEPPAGAADETPDPAEGEGDSSPDPAVEVERLRGELWAARVAATGVLIDPEALPYDATLLDSPDGIRAAATDLVARKPWLRANPTTSDVGQHERADAGTPFSLSAALQAAAN